MGKTLDNLIRLHKFQVDEKRKYLTQQLDELDALTQKLTDLENQLIEEQRIAAADQGQALFAYARFAQKSMTIREGLHELIAKKERDVEVARDNVTEAFKELKTYEEAEKSRIQREKDKQKRKENIEMDEIGMNLFRRQNN